MDSSIRPEVGKHYLTSIGIANIKSRSIFGREQSRWYGHCGDKALLWNEFGQAFSEFAAVMVRQGEFDLKEEIVYVYFAKWSESIDEPHTTPFFTTKEMARAAAISDINKRQGYIPTNLTVEAIRVYTTSEQVQVTRVIDLLEHVKSKLTADEWALLKTRLQFP